MSEITRTANAITVTGKGSVSAQPDYFHISVGIEARRNTVKEAYAAAANAITAIQQRLLELSLARDVVGTEALNVHADEQWLEGKTRAIVGYIVTSSLNVILSYDEAAADVIAAVVDVGGDAVRIHGLRPAVSDLSAAKDAARAVAWADAVHAADMYAALAGRTLGTATAITEMVDQGMIPMARAMSTGADAGIMALPMEPGQSSITATVEVTWNLI
ncbi:SIMPL domain-containing protein [Arthrobacter sp. A2-55]|uniref:SIMPL domain-containing protein n=1 Tax=Arthrobacter sp. A2-55 TaxID=2897337 RepID=UPI0021CD5A36|nr:SIMPL domain-containing protein [Arthrobacter sp. A2-55]MCU6479484.1 SIMPL domain-containing protein [Arthrobacter sp. A2-55]